MPTISHQAPGRRPQQQRARRTRERILVAVERLLEHKRFEDITLGEIVGTAGASVGSFYHLFASKDALVPPLYARYDAAITALADRLLDRRRWQGRGLAYRATRLLRYGARALRDQRGLMRALALHARSHPEHVTAEQRGRRMEFYERVAALLLECRTEIAHPDPERAVELGLFFVGAALRDKILFDQAPHPQSLEIDDRRLAADLAAALLAFLQRSPSEGSDS